MLKQRARAVAAGLRGLDLGLLVLAFGLAYWVRSALPGTLPDLYAPDRYLAWVAAALLLWSPAAGASHVYAAYRTRSLGVEVLRLGRATVTLALLLGTGTFIAHDHQLSRLLFGIWLATALVLFAASRVVLRTTARAVRRRGRNTRAFAVVGSGPLAVAMARRLGTRPEWGLRFCGYIVEPDGAVRRGAQVLGAIEDMGKILDLHVLDLVVVAVGRDRLRDVEEAIALCEEQGVPVKIALDLFPAIDAQLEIEELDGIPLLSLASGPQEVLPLLAKRAFDVVLSALGLLVLSPVLALVALAVRLDSPGPVLFRQRRVGLNGREFTLYKLRSMRVGAEDELHALRQHNEADGPVFKMRDDPRVTAVGRFIRRASLDELPQLWNVLRGEMSVVGPRPPLPEEVRRYERWQRRRLSMKPGITCTWQISGRSDLEFDRWMELDLAYIDGWSLWRDLRIVAQTIPAVLLRRGAR
ncbi:sugar transferase [Anaeromyxobacter sp. SG64]|uniref:sugar transferase n=1 Tax=Anaeromyxobacter sp. SG64 TaxID=2925409 RepID=UPI001F58819E|nr:sugar transferase [Anaeromyxobacter sp. SG64]